MDSLGTDIIEFNLFYSIPSSSMKGLTRQYTLIFPFIYYKDNIFIIDKGKGGGGGGWILILFTYYSLLLYSFFYIISSSI